MSIIEKAAGKLTQKADAPRLPPASEVAAATGSQPASAIGGHSAERGERPHSRRVDIDFAHLHRLGMVAPDGGRTAIAEEFRAIKRPLIDKAMSPVSSTRHGNLIMVTSALAGEGKTFCAINLALSIATEMDHTVLLVDADIARPAVPDILGFSAEVGLMDVLLDHRLDMADVMLRTNVDKLRILPAGRSHKHAAELLASQSMTKLLDEIANRYSDRIVIFDSPPLLPTTEARSLASQMGQIVLVVAAEETTQNAVKEALRQVEPRASVSLVYNKARGFPGRKYYAPYYNS